ncbi:NACHT domain-containing NTPase [Nostoc sp. C057]|uniref:NACHT domain-containing protein n=1 Tax=Nostoc sp. C057 TaxID=2576903 RepID=UPI0021183539|nr:NACHT domain-containing protein [Nostoc sp. C057]
MSQQLPENSDSQQPDANSTQQADSSTPQNVVQGNQNRVVQGNENQSVLGDSNTVIQGNNNLMLTIKELILGQQTTPVGNPARPKNERILLAAVKEEVTARLRQSLHNAVLINLGKESQPQQVKRPWDAEIKIGIKPPEPLPDTTTILEVFDSPEIAGKLLILGAPGSGKTTTQLELAQALVGRAEEQPDYPVPVLFNLSTWKDDRQSITDWLVAELKSKYGVSKKLGQEWVNNHQLLPLLDGLDELEPQRQELCVQKINQFLAGETRPLYLVVCSRIEEYSNYSTQLQLNGAIYLQPLTSNQICDYLTSINSIELWSTISSDLDLLELMKTPLLLSITVLVSQEISVEEWQHLNSTADQIQYLLDAYIGRMLTRNINSRTYFKNKSPNAKQTRMWLIWLAQQLQKELQNEFILEKIQPSSLLSLGQIRTFRLQLLISISATLWLFFYLIGAKSSGLFYGLILALFFANKEKIQIIETLTINKWIEVKKQILKGFKAGLLIRKNFLILILWFLSSFLTLLSMPLIPNIQFKFTESFLNFNSILINILSFVTFVMVNFLIIINLSAELKMLEAVEILFGLPVKRKTQIFINICKKFIQFLFKPFQRMIEVFDRIPQGLHELVVLGLAILFLWIFVYLKGISPKFILLSINLDVIYTDNFGSVIFFIFYLGILGSSSLIGYFVFCSWTGVFWGGILGLISWLTGSEIEVKTRANEGIWKTLINAIILGIIIGLIWVAFNISVDLFLNFIYKFVYKSPYLYHLPNFHHIINDLIIGFIFGWFFGGGGACIQHFILRLILYRNGYIPWNYARFLDYCTERLFLQRVGGRYRFIHKLLQDHFAQMEFKRD